MQPRPNIGLAGHLRILCSVTEKSVPGALKCTVLDSKRGPGPKHMKEITKRARRREARAAVSQLSQFSCSSTIAKHHPLAFRQQQQQQQQQHHHHHQSGSVGHPARWADLGCTVGIALTKSPHPLVYVRRENEQHSSCYSLDALAAADCLADFCGSPQSSSHSTITTTSTPNSIITNGGNTTNPGSNCNSGGRKSVVSGQPTCGKSALAGGVHCSARRCSCACCASTRSSVSSGYYSKVDYLGEGFNSGMIPVARSRGPFFAPDRAHPLT
ncbi:unnamed protein product [Schistocephalus solidus]|uniref:Uncharacterized protein n=1 Tax=Schistocephalus solidus TaxID=70667 RepID=A0A183T6Q3_SCHSO|nr:unnamed protein product [Schistocephalus solidus]